VIEYKSLLQVLGLCVLPNFRYSSKCFAEIYWAQYGNAMLVHIRGTPIWRPENNVNIWNLLWLSRRLIISTEQTSICVSPFTNNLTSKKARNHEIKYIFFNKLDRRLVSRTSITLNFNYALVSKQSTLLSCKIVNKYKYTASYTFWGLKLWWLFSFGLKKMMRSRENDLLKVGCCSMMTKLIF